MTSAASGGPDVELSSVHAEVVDVPMRSFLAVDGHGPPDSAGYRQAVGVLRAVSEAACAVIEHRGRVPVHTVQPLETLWSAPSGHSDEGSWSWTALIPQPSTVTSNIVVVSRIKAARSVPAGVLAGLRWWHWREGLSAQLLHLEPFHPGCLAQRQLDEFIRASGRQARGRCHELRLGQPEGEARAGERTLLRRQIGPGAPAAEGARTPRPV